MTDKPDNPPAFPRDYGAHTPNGSIEFFGPDGMTLRDYFAAKALQGIIASGRVAKAHLSAEDAYHLADAMLRQRQEPTDGR